MISIPSVHIKIQNDLKRVIRYSRVGDRIQIQVRLKYWGQNTYVN